MKNKLKVGDTVKSHFRAKWTGKVIDIELRSNGLSPIAVVKVFLDRNGRPLRKPIRKRLDSNWLEKLNGIEV